MKRSILLCVFLSLFLSPLLAQKNEKKQKTTAYAITAVQKGQNSWTEVRLVDVASGEVIQTIYESKQETQPLNARTGKPIVKKDVAQDNTRVVRIENLKADNLKMEKEALANAKVALVESKKEKQKKVVDLDDALGTRTVTVVQGTPHVAPVPNVNVRTHVNNNVVVAYHATSSRVRQDAPFATNSAACAFDRKHNRLYYTPMGISQLRYIDLKSNKIYYYEDEKFGALSGPRDVPNQITRMVIAKDGNGYALTNNAEHLMRFTTNKKAEIVDLGPLTDAEGNTTSVKNSQGYGGDMIASEDGTLYLFTANRRVFKIDINSRVATYLGNIKGLPRDFSTNGAAVDEGMKVVVTSANSTLGYFVVDMKTLQAEKLSASADVYNASDLANNNFLGEKKKKKDQPQEEPKEVVNEVITSSTAVERQIPQELPLQSKISLYPNPVSTGAIKISFEEYPNGRYQVQFMDMAGKLINSQSVTINNKVQIEEYRLPSNIAKGNYLVQIVNEENKAVSLNKLVVQ